MRCEKTAESFAAFVAFACGLILVKSVQGLIDFIPFPAPFYGQQTYPTLVSAQSNYWFPCYSTL
jgi:hypothetical protein